MELKDAPECLNMKEEDCLVTWISLPKSRFPKSWDSIQDPVGYVRTQPLWTSFGRFVVGTKVGGKSR